MGQNDSLTIGHISDKRKASYLPYNQQSDYIEEQYSARAMQFPNVSFVRKETKLFRGTHKCLWDLAILNSASLVVIGLWGRKGPKQPE